MYITALIKHLHKDKCITAEEASRLTSTKLFTAPDVVKSATEFTKTNTANTNNETFTYALLDHRGQLQHISMAESLPPVIVKIPNAHETSNNAPVTSTSMQYMVQSLQCINTVDVTENLSDDVPEHDECEMDHGLMASLAHNQQNTTTEGR